MNITLPITVFFNWKKILFSEQKNYSKLYILIIKFLYVTPNLYAVLYICKQIEIHGNYRNSGEMLL